MVVIIAPHVATLGYTKNGRWEGYRVDGKLYGKRVDYNADDLVRDLIADRYGDPDSILQTVAANGTPSMRGQLGEWVKWKLTESSTSATGSASGDWKPLRPTKALPLVGRTEDARSRLPSTQIAPEREIVLPG